MAVTLDAEALARLPAKTVDAIVAEVVAGGAGGFLDVANARDIDVVALEQMLRAHDCDQCEVCEGWARNAELVFGEDGVNRCDSCSMEITNKAPEPEEEPVYEDPPEGQPAETAVTAVDAPPAGGASPADKP